MFEGSACHLLSLFAMPRYVSHRIENWPASGHGLEHQHGLWTYNSISNTEQPHQGTWRRWGHGQTWTRVRATCCCTRPGILQNWLVVVVKSAGSGSGKLASLTSGYTCKVVLRFGWCVKPLPLKGSAPQTEWKVRRVPTLIALWRFNVSYFTFLPLCLCYHDGLHHL